MVLEKTTPMLTQTNADVIKIKTSKTTAQKRIIVEKNDITNTLIKTRIATAKDITAEEIAVFAISLEAFIVKNSVAILLPTT